MKRVAVVIPTYKKELSELEEISLAQAETMFENYDKFFAMPYPLDILYSSEHIGELRFEGWSGDYGEYNSLMMSAEFYRRFERYEYILLYQLDAFVFEDRLEHFCSLGHDYIGAPWISGPQYAWDHKNHVSYVGNGGFSLRRVRACIELTGQKKLLLPQDVYEDTFFSLARTVGFQVAPLETALEFSFEGEVRRCFAANGNRLPFGCHAWEKYDLAFWKPYIEGYGHRIDDRYLPDGNKDLEFAERNDRTRRTAFFLGKTDRGHVLGEYLRKLGKKIYIWGAGARGRFFAILLSEAGADIEGYLDNRAELEGTRVETYKVLPMKDLGKDGADAYVIIAAERHGTEIAGQLEGMGYRYGQDYAFCDDILVRLAEDYGYQDQWAL